MSDFKSQVGSLLQRRLRQLIGDTRDVSEPMLRDTVAAEASFIAEEIDRIMHSRRSVKWNQRAVTEWQNATFGQPRSNLGIAIRANEEMAELLRCLVRNDEDQDARMEVADVVIVLCRLVERLGGRMADDVATKMEVNVKRTWKPRGDGHGQHIPEKKPF